MKDVDPLAQALDACLDQAGTAGDIAPAVASAWPEVADNFADDLAPLIEIARALRAEPALDGPTPAFRRQLAATLMSAPFPRSLQASSLQTSPLQTSSLQTSPAVKLEAVTAAHSTSALVQALDSGLRGVQAGLDVDDVLEAHPDIAPDLEPLLVLAAELASFPPIPVPSEAFRRRLAADLAVAPKPRSIAARAETGWVRRLWRSTAFTAAAAATFVLFLTAGVTYASANALPGDLLYPVKRLSEQARVWLAGGDVLNLHLMLADRRLKEALRTPDRAGDLLADFSREVTAGLGAVDRRLATGEPRLTVTAPVLQWLLGARSRLVDGRPKLPPTAWRAALAMVDEAIAALRSGGPLSIAPVPRLAGGGDDGRARAVIVPRLRPAARLIAAGSRPPGSPSRLRHAPPATGSAEPAEARAFPGVPMVATAAPAAATAPAAGIATVVPVTRKPEETDEPDDPTPEPVATGDVPIVVPNTDTPTAAPTETATPIAPTASPTMPVNLPPVIVSVSCTPQKLEGYGEATCTVVATTDPEGGELTYAWYVSPLHGEMKSPDKPESKLQVWPPGSGYEPRPITIQITVTDAAGQSTGGKTEVIVVPVLEGER